MQAKLSSKLQISIPRAIRENLAIRTMLITSESHFEGLIGVIHFKKD